jgi:nucleoside diphosphate kinase
MAIPKERSYALLKPDAYERGLVSDIEDAIVAEGLRIVERFKVRMRDDDIRDLYCNLPAYVHAKLFEHLAGELTDVWIVEGDRAVARTLAVKRRFRWKHQALNGIARLLHSPDSVQDFARELSVLRRCAVTDSSDPE